MSRRRAVRLHPLGSRLRPLAGKSGRGRRIAKAILLLALAAGPAQAWGIEADALGSLGEESLGKSLQGEEWNRNAPVDIHSEQMSVDFEKHRIVFKGDVQVLQSDFSLKAGEVTAVFGASADDIQKIIASDHVEIRKADKTAWGEQVVYDRPSATILLRGNAVLKQGRNFIKGEEIHFSLDEDRMEVKGDVQAEFPLSGQKEGLDETEQGTETGEQGPVSGK